MHSPKSSIGSTPSCSHPVPDMAMLSEVHPGNYVFYGQCLMSFSEMLDKQFFILSHIFVLEKVTAWHRACYNEYLFRCAAVSHWIL